MNENRLTRIILLCLIFAVGYDVWADFNASPVGWDAAFEADPDNTDSLGQADDHLRQIKIETSNRLETEMDFGEFDNVTTDTGRLLEGAARAFVQGSEPTADGTITANCLAEADYDGNRGCDEGRLLIRTDQNNLLYFCQDDDADGDCDDWEVVNPPGGECYSVHAVSYNPTEAGATDDYVSLNLVDLATGAASFSATEGNENFFIIPQAPGGMVASNLRVATDVAPGVGNDDWVVTLRADSVSQTLTCTLDEANTSCTDTTNTPTITAGQRINWLVTSSGAAADPNAAAVMFISFCLNPVVP